MLDTNPYHSVKFGNIHLLLRKKIFIYFKILVNPNEAGLLEGRGLIQPTTFRSPRITVIKQKKYLFTESLK